MQKVTNALFSLKEATASFAPQDFVTKCFLIFIFDKVKNFTANNLLQVGVLVTYWEPCIFGQSRTGIRAKGWCSYIEEFRGSEAVEGLCCKFIYRDCKVQGQRFCTRSETSLNYNELLFGKVSPRFFTVKLVCFIGFSGSSYLVLFIFPLHDFDMILMIVCFNKIYS